MNLKVSQEKAISIMELAESLGVTPAIIRSWQSKLNLQVPKDNQEDWLYNLQWQEIFKQIAVLRKVGSGFDKIAEQLKLMLPDATQESPAIEADASYSTKAKRPATRKNKKEKKADLKKPLSPDEANQSEQVRSYIPPTLSSDESRKVVRSNISEKEMLGLYGPPPVQVERSSQELEHPVQQNQQHESREMKFLTGDKSGGLTAFESLIEEKKSKPVVQWTPTQASEELNAIDTTMSQALSEQDVEKMVSSYVRLVESYQALSSRYSESTYHIGQLETEKKMLNAQLQKREQEENEQMAQMKAHVSSLKKMLDTQEERIDKQAESLVTVDKVDSVEKQIKLLTLAVLNEQKEKQKGFLARIKRVLTRKLI